MDNEQQNQPEPGTPESQGDAELDRTKAELESYQQLFTNKDDDESPADYIRSLESTIIYLRDKQEKMEQNMDEPKPTEPTAPQPAATPPPEPARPPEPEPPPQQQADSNEMLWLALKTNWVEFRQDNPEEKLSRAELDKIVLGQDYQGDLNLLMRNPRYNNVYAAARRVVQLENLDKEQPKADPPPDSTRETAQPTPGSDIPPAPKKAAPDRNQTAADKIAPDHTYVMPTDL